jgi:hypothetical protein
MKGELAALAMKGLDKEICFGFCWVVIGEGKGCGTEKYVQLNF